MSAPLAPQIVPTQRRLLRPLPTPGASKRVRAAKDVKPPAGLATSSESTVSKDSTKSTSNEDNVPTPKPSTKDLPTESSTPKVPTIKLNDGPVQEPSAPFVIDEAKDAELREKFLKMQLQERPLPKLKIPKKVKPPPKQAQRQMARVKPAIKTAPRPEISFGATVTTFGAQTEDSGEQNSEKESEPAPLNLHALMRRQIREKQDRLGLSRRKPQILLPQEPEDGQGEDDSADSDESDSDSKDVEETRKENIEKMKQITLMMARDIQQFNIPKSRLKAMAKGKTEEETAARKRVLEMAWKLAKRHQDKDKGKGKQPVKGERGQAEGEPDREGSESESPEGDKGEIGDKKAVKSVDETSLKQGEKRRKSKGKEGASTEGSTSTKPSS